MTIKLLCLRKYHSGPWSACTPPDASANSNLVTADFLIHVSGFKVRLRKMALLVIYITCWQTLATNNSMKTTGASVLVHQLWCPFRHIGYPKEVSLKQTGILQCKACISTETQLWQMSTQRFRVVLMTVVHACKTPQKERAGFTIHVHFNKK